jgi:hypothetical protein
MPTKKERLIYTITTVRLKEENWRTRCVGYYNKKSDAIKAVENNDCDIYECGYYPFAVIETVGQGIYDINREEIWFEWNKAKSQYEILANKPEMFKQTCCYGIG